MKRTSLFALCAIVTALSVQAQEMIVIHQDGHTDQFTLADIDSITFSLPAAKADFVVRDRLQSTDEILFVYVVPLRLQLARLLP